MSNKELIEYFEHVRYQVAGFDKKQKSEIPQFSGSGFILEHNGLKVFVTAGHVATTQTDGTIEYDKNVLVQTNSIYYDTELNRYCCCLVSCSEIVTISAFHFDPITMGLGHESVVDVVFTIFDEVRSNAPFVTQKIDLESACVKYGEKKGFFKSTDIATVSTTDTYAVFGRVKLFFEKVDENNVLQSTVIFHTGLKFVYETKDMYELQYDKPIIIDEWKGLSGSPVLNQYGKLLGVACSVDPFANTLSVMKIRNVLSYIEAEIKTSGLSKLGIL